MKVRMNIDNSDDHDQIYDHNQSKISYEICTKRIQGTTSLQDA